MKVLKFIIQAKIISMKYFRISLFLFFSILIWQCTPKVLEETQTTPVEEPKPKPKVIDESLSKCTKFSDIRNEDEIVEAYVIYRDFKKLKQYDQSFDMWKKVYQNAPAADGKRWTVYSDGIIYYEYFISKEADSLKRAEYIDKIFVLYDEIAECYPEQYDYIQGRKAFDYYYKYPYLVTEDEKYLLFKHTIDAKGMDVPVFVINPFTKLMVDRFLNSEIPQDEARKYAELIPAIVDHNVTKGKDLKSWIIVKEYAPVYIERLESVEGFFDCKYFSDKYYPQYQAEPTNCELAISVYSKLRFAGCEKSNPKLVEIYGKLVENECIEVKPTEKGPARLAYECLQEGQYRCAVENYDKAIQESGNMEDQARWALTIAKIYYAHLKNFPKARSFARKAAGFKDNWGEPYILIGKLYASSGPLCGPGRGFDSQVVTWPAIDKWNYAKSIDPSVSSEATKLIKKYTQYMPDIEDIFQRGLKTGQNFKVECWIQENTKIRIRK
jgi:tetratricopeptide (TPR) repeat protein